VVQAAVDVIAPSAEAAGVTLAVALDATPGVLGDASRLQQVVWNLLANAVKFTPRGGHVQVTLRDSGDHVEIGVSDSGVGISPDMLPHIFDRFRQADGSITRRFGGLGLGLSIVRTLVDMHHGSVAVHSEGSGQGTAFTVRLPALAASTEALPVPVTDDDLDAVLDGVEALVVDDDDNARELLGRILEQHGVRVRACAGAQAALLQLAERARDVLISDIGMPGLDGYSFIEQVRRLPAALGGGVPAIALTAFARPEDRRRALATGYQEHLAKPLEPGRLLASIRRLVIP
jgi:CheY-like chemotaxis protein/anti-sigma regulatory factor (Ser/Thr protein kinase)